LIVSFNDITPIERFDGVPWTEVQIEESSLSDGPYVIIDTQTLSPIDTDPANPQARDITTANALIEKGWYRISFLDAASNISSLPVVQSTLAIAWRPTLMDVGALDLARTRDANGVPLKTFTVDTIPTGDDVERLIDKSVNNLRPQIGTEIPADLVQEAQDVAALRTAMYIELTYFANEVAQNRSPYPQYKELYDEKVPILRNAISAEEAGMDVTDAVGGQYPSYKYPDPVVNFYSDPL